MGIKISQKKGSFIKALKLKDSVLGERTLRISAATPDTKRIKAAKKQQPSSTPTNFELKPGKKKRKRKAEKEKAKKKARAKAKAKKRARKNKAKEKKMSKKASAASKQDANPKQTPKKKQRLN
jgi:hypothetical protein